MKYIAPGMLQAALQFYPVTAQYGAKVMLTV